MTRNERKIDFRSVVVSARETWEGEAPAPVPADRVPSRSRLTALAIRLD